MANEVGGAEVLVVTPWYPTEKNAISGMFVLREVDAMTEAGMNVKVIHLDRDIPDGAIKAATVHGHRVLRVGFRPSSPLSLVKALRPLRRALEGADVINSHAISSLPLVALAKRKIPWIHTEHWSALSNPKSATPLLRAVRPIFASLLRLPDAVVAESEMLAEPIRRFRGGKPVDLVPCIVPAPKQLIERQVRPKAIRLASTGGVIDRKDPLLSVRTLAALRDRGVEASLRWTGEGDLREEAQELAAELGVDAQFLGLGSPDDVEREIADADVFFAPTKGENFFVAAAEALVSGRPLVASQLGGHTEYANPAFAEIVTERTPEAYADAVIQVLDKSEGVLAEEISSSVRERFSPAKVAQQYKEIYERVTG